MSAEFTPKTSATVWWKMIASALNLLAPRIACRTESCFAVFVNRMVYFRFALEINV